MPLGYASTTMFETLPTKGLIRSQVQVARQAYQVPERIKSGKLDALHKKLDKLDREIDGQQPPPSTVGLEAFDIRRIKELEAEIANAQARTWGDATNKASFIKTAQDEITTIRAGKYQGGEIDIHRVMKIWDEMSPSNEWTIVGTKYGDTARFKNLAALEKRLDNITMEINTKKKWADVDQSLYNSKGDWDMSQAMIRRKHIAEKDALESWKTANLGKEAKTTQGTTKLIAERKVIQKQIDELEEGEAYTFGKDVSSGFEMRQMEDIMPRTVEEQVSGLGVGVPVAPATLKPISFDLGQGFKQMFGEPTLTTTTTARRVIPLKESGVKLFTPSFGKFQTRISQDVLTNANLIRQLAQDATKVGGGREAFFPDVKSIITVKEAGKDVEKMFEGAGKIKALADYKKVFEEPIWFESSTADRLALRITKAEKNLKGYKDELKIQSNAKPTIPKDPTLKQMKRLEHWENEIDRLKRNVKREEKLLTEANAERGTITTEVIQPPVIIPRNLGGTMPASLIQGGKGVRGIGYMIDDLTRLERRIDLMPWGKGAEFESAVTAPERYGKFGVETRVQEMFEGADWTRSYDDLLGIKRTESEALKSYYGVQRRAPVETFANIQKVWIAKK